MLPNQNHSQDTYQHAQKNSADDGRDDQPTGALGMLRGRRHIASSDGLPAFVRLEYGGETDAAAEAEAGQYGTLEVIRRRFLQRFSVGGNGAQRGLPLSVAVAQRTRAWRVRWWLLHYHRNAPWRLAALGVTLGH